MEWQDKDQKKNEKGLKRKGAQSAWLWGPLPDDMETMDHLIPQHQPSFLRNDFPL